ncbi:MAG: hypothetical protein JNM13_01260 [Hyphomicrobiaceae bacterium]|nr:hypothetical protein [Hyphomicrobiaceae bacterium]
MTPSNRTAPIVVCNQTRTAELIRNGRAKHRESGQEILGMNNFYLFFCRLGDKRRESGAESG